MYRILTFLTALSACLLANAELLPDDAWQLWASGEAPRAVSARDGGEWLLANDNGVDLQWVCHLASPSPGRCRLTAEAAGEGHYALLAEQWQDGQWRSAAVADAPEGGRLTTEFDIAPGTDLVKVILLLRGPGRVTFRDVELEKLDALLPDAVRSDGEFRFRVGGETGRPVNRKVFGGHYFDIRDQENAYADLGMTVCREGGPGFFSPGRLRPDGGDFQWGELDRFLDWAAGNGITVLALPGGPAAWLAPPEADGERFNAGWSDFTAAVARHARDRGTPVRYWEIWNEPDGGHWFGKPWHAGAHEYAPLYLEAARKLKAADPDIRVGTGGMADPFRGSIDRWWVPVAQSPGVAELIDFVALHGYYGDPANQIFAEGIDHMRRRMRECLGREVPLWITEFNVHPLEDFTRRGYPFSLQALMVAEYLALFVQKDIESAQYFCVGWWESDFSPWDAATRQPRPVFRAYQFWKDFDGSRLEVESTHAAALPAAACRRDDGSRVLYLTARQPGRYVVEFSDVPENAAVVCEAFHGDGITPVITETVRRDGLLTLTAEWPQGARALWRVTVR